MSRSDDRRGKEEYFKYHTWDWEFKGTPKPKKRMLFSNPADQLLRPTISVYRR